MSGFFRGPSLLTHAVVLGVIEALAIPQVYAAYKSVTIMVVVGAVIGALYALAALSLTSNFFKH